MNNQASFFSERSQARKGLARVLGMIVSAAIMVVGANEAVKPSALWYWTPLSEPKNLTLYALATSDQEYDVLVIGSSLSGRGIIPQVIDDELNQNLPRKKRWLTYNASMDAAFLPTYLAIMRGIVGKKTFPAIVIVGLGRHDLYTSAPLLERQIRYHNRTLEDLARTFVFAGSSGQRWSALQALDHGMESLLQIPLSLEKYSRAVQILKDKQGSAYLWPLDEENMEKNMRFLPKGKALENFRRERLEKYLTEMSPDFDSNSLVDYWLAAIIEEAERKKVTLIFLFFPESSYHLERSTGAARERALKRLAPYCTAPHVQCADLQQAPFRPDDSRFFDFTNHLDPAGAEKLSRQIGREILTILLRNNSPTPAAPSGKSVDHGL